MNGTALAIDPSTGRILAMVNQKVALSSGAEPCSTIKLAVSLAALDEGLITKDTPVNLGGHFTMTLTTALAKSINPYSKRSVACWASSGSSTMPTSSALANWPGTTSTANNSASIPTSPCPSPRGGVGRMCSFGERSR